MTNSQRGGSSFRSTVSVLAGAVAGIVLSIGTDMVLRSVGIFPVLGQVVPNALLLLATAYRTIYGVLGSYITARLAPNRPMVHAMVLGGLGLIANLVGTVTTWNKGPASGPHWYPILLTVLALPTAWIGGFLGGGGRGES